jgi:S1-C subfamily serine protease
LKEANLVDFSTDINIWQFVIAIWNALAEYQDSVTFGILSAKWRYLEDTQDSIYIWLYQTDAAINPWNSGWPLIDIVWQVIWLNTAITASWQWIGFTLPVNRQFIQATLKSIKQNSIIKRPLLGVQILQLTKEISQKFDLTQTEWVLIQDIMKYSPAEKYGLQKWDIILEINNNKIDINRPIIYTLFTNNIDDTVKVKFDRKWEIIEKDIVLFEF